MGYAITAGAGLLLGLALMIWGLTERSKRSSAERAAAKSEADRLAAVAIAQANVAKVAEVEAYVKRVELESSTLRLRLAETRKRLAESGDPVAIKAWLDDETKAEEL